jgi:3-methyladenine DNA glycosylase AlkD
LSRSSGTFDAQRYFRGGADLRFYNVGSEAVRDLAKAIFRAHHDAWTVADAMTLADELIEDAYLDTKAVGVELVRLFRRQFTPRMLPRWKRWLVRNHSTNWATTDAICGYLIGPLVLAHPALVPRVAAWSRDRNMWVRRASAVSLIPSVRQGLALDAAYGVAKRLHADPEDLIQKAAGWMLREAGKTDPARLERYLKANVRRIPRTTFRYAIERFDNRKRRELLAL